MDKKKKPSLSKRAKLISAKYDQLREEAIKKGLSDKASVKYITKGMPKPPRPSPTQNKHSIEQLIEGLEVAKSIATSKAKKKQIADLIEGLDVALSIDTGIKSEKATYIKAVSSSEDGIIELISEFYYGSTITLKPSGVKNVWDVYNKKGRIDKVRVIKKRRRYRFELIDYPIKAKGGGVDYEKVMAMGTCYDDSFKMAIDEVVKEDSDAMIFYGLVRDKYARDKTEFLHSWVEKDGKVYDSRYSNPTDKKTFYDLNEVIKSKSFTPEQVLKNVMRDRKGVTGTLWNCSTEQRNQIIELQQEYMPSKLAYEKVMGKSYADGGEVDKYKIGTQYEKYIVGSPKWNKSNKNRKKTKSKSQKLIDKIAQKEFSKNYSDLNNSDKYFVDDAYASIQSEKGGTTYQEGGEISKNINSQLKDLGFVFNNANYRYGKKINENTYISAYYDRNKKLFKIGGVKKFKTRLGNNSVGIKFEYDNQKEFWNKINEYISDDNPDIRFDDGGKFPDTIEEEFDTYTKTMETSTHTFYVSDAGDEYISINKADDRKMDGYGVDELIQDELIKGNDTWLSKDMKYNKREILKEHTKNYAKGGKTYQEGGEITNVNYIWRSTPSLVTLKKIKKSPKGRYSGLFHYSEAEGIITEEHEKWEKLSRDNAEYILKEHKKNYAKGGKTDPDWIQEATESPDFRKGAFTRKAKKRGLTPEQFMSKVLNNPNRYNERTRKQAQFMKNMND